MHWLYWCSILSFKNYITWLQTREPHIETAFTSRSGSENQRVFLYKSSTPLFMSAEFKTGCGSAGTTYLFSFPKLIWDGAQLTFSVQKHRNCFLCFLNLLKFVCFTFEWKENALMRDCVVFFWLKLFKNNTWEKFHKPVFCQISDNSAHSF